MDQDKTRRKIIEFVKENWKKRRKVPTIDEILAKFGLNRSKLYRFFPNGLAEICELAEVPCPEKRLKACEKAKEAHRNHEIPLGSSNVPPDLVNAYLGIGAWEGITDVELIMRGVVEWAREFIREGGTFKNWKETRTQAENWRELVGELTRHRKDSEDTIHAMRRLIKERSQYSERAAKAEQENHTLKAEKESEIGSLTAKLQSKDYEIETEKRKVAATKDKEIEAFMAEIQALKTENQSKDSKIERLCAELTKRDNENSEYNQLRKEHGDRLPHRFQLPTKQDNFEELIHQSEERLKTVETKRRDLEQNAQYWQEMKEQLKEGCNNLFEKGSRALEVETAKNPHLMQMFIEYANPVQLRFIIDKLKLNPLESQQLFMELQMQRMARNMGIVYR